MSTDILSQASNDHADKGASCRGTGEHLIDARAQHDLSLQLFAWEKTRRAHRVKEHVEPMRLLDYEARELVFQARVGRFCESMACQDIRCVFRACLD